jgi:hypothetical protein
MTDSPNTRLASAQLEDLVIVALTARAVEDSVTLYPTLDDGRRATLRSRIKLIGRHDWPANLREDSLLRRGYTLRQCFRLVTAVTLIDAMLPPSLAVSIAMNNELTFLRAIAAGLRTYGSKDNDTDADLICVIVLGDMWQQVDQVGWLRAETGRVRLVERAQLGQCWSESADLASSGHRLLVDIATSARAVWQWLSSRRLMTKDDRLRLISAVDEDLAAPGYRHISDRTWRR